MLLGTSTQDDRMIGPFEEAKIANLLDPLNPASSGSSEN